MKKNATDFLTFITGLTTMFGGTLITPRKTYSSSNKPSIYKSNPRLSQTIPTTVSFSFGILCIIIGVVTEMKVSYYILPTIMIMFSSMYWFRDSESLVVSDKASKKTHPNKLSKKNGFDTFSKINSYIITEKKYQSANTCLYTIASRFDISRGYLSQLINTHTQKSFNDYINELRIQDAKGMLIRKEYDHYTIECIGLECGFKSKSNFYTTFKKLTGLTPNQYKKLKK